MGPQMSVRNIQGWTDRNLLDWDEARSKPGKNEPRLYSFADVIRLHSMNVAVTYGGVAVKNAVKIGKIALDRFIEKYDAGDRSFDDCESPWKILIWFLFNNGKELRYRIELPEDIADCFRANGKLTLPTDIALTGSTFFVDELIYALWCNYIEIDEDFNQKALEGRLKPFPKWLL